MNPSKHSTAFTVPELLVALYIAVMLAVVFLPNFRQTATRGVQTKALSNAKSIAYACKVYALDYNEAFPKYTNLVTRQLASASTSSNAVLQPLIPDYLPEKSIFIVPNRLTAKMRARLPPIPPFSELAKTSGLTCLA